MRSIITVENLSKKYTIGHQKQGDYQTLRDTLSHGIRNIYQLFRHPFSPNSEKIDTEDFWALKDVNFDVQQGDRFGIIGRNGAGKSTLLKILSRITHPTTGKIHIKGRVASLLEVGTGFHPELTGRENIFLNGAILGMTKTDIRLRFDEIVAFAEIEKFLDTPVKRYSSGMYVRLAFAVAAHLEPEILLVDEVLAVGDAVFQKKCLGKMEDVGSEGKTVLFVSHNMNAIQQLCDKIIWIENGITQKISSDVQVVTKNYLFDTDIRKKVNVWHNSENQFDSPNFKPIRFYLSCGGKIKNEMYFTNNSEIWVEIVGEIKTVDPALQIGYALYSEDGQLLYWTCHNDVEEKMWPKLKPGLCHFKSKLPKRLFNEGLYKIELIAALYCREWLCAPGKHPPTIHFIIQGELSDSPYWMVKRPGLLAPVIKWHTD